MAYIIAAGFYLLVGILESINFKREFPEANIMEVILTIVTIPAIAAVGLIRKCAFAIACLFL